MRRCVLVSAICLSLAAQENPLDSAVTFNPGGKFTGSTLPLDRTQVLRIKVDAQALLAAYVMAPPDLKNECGRLRIAIDALLKTQRFALQHDLGMSRLSARKAAGASREEQLAMREELSPIARERNLAFDTFRAQLKEMSLLDPALRDQLVARLLNRSDQPYADMAEMLRKGGGWCCGACLWRWGYLGYQGIHRKCHDPELPHGASMWPKGRRCLRPRS